MADEVVEFLARKVEGDAFGRFGASGLLHGVKRSDGSARKARQRPRSRQDTAWSVPQSSGTAAWCEQRTEGWRRRLLLSDVPDDNLLPVDDLEVYRQIGEMLVSLNEAEKSLARVHAIAVNLGALSVIEHLDSDLFWKVRVAGDHLRDLLDVDRVRGLGY